MTKTDIALIENQLDRSHPMWRYGPLDEMVFVSRADGTVSLVEEVSDGMLLIDGCEWVSAGWR